MQTGAGEQQAANAFATETDIAKRGYDIGIPALEAGINGIQSGLATGGEPDYLKSAWAGQRTAISDALAGTDSASAAAGAARTKGAVLGGNVGATVVPPSYGARLARALTGSRVNEAIGSLDETTKLMGLGLGAGGQAGNAGLRAGANEMGAISMLPQYNQTSATIQGGAALAGGMYGALAGRGGIDPGVEAGVLGGTSGLGMAGGF